MMFGAKCGTGFGGTIDYATDRDGRNDKDARILYAEGVNVYYNAAGKLDADSRELARSFRAQAMLNPKVKKCVKHIWISYKSEDPTIMVNNYFKGKRHFTSLEDTVSALGQKKVDEITDMAMISDTIFLLKEMKYDQTQFLIVRHSEKGNPHVHVILNMVDNEGNRLKDFQEKRRGYKTCRKITLSRHYTWGEHKSISETDINNPKEIVRTKICKEVFDITRLAKNAEQLKAMAASRGIGVKFTTNYKTGIITGVSFEMEGFKFPAGRVDSSLSAKKIFYSQESSRTSLSELQPGAQDIVKSGGVVGGFNNQTLYVAEVPELPISVQESKTRDEYHKAIKLAAKNGSRTAYLQNVVGLALDPGCGSPQARAEAVAPYIIEEATGQPVAVHQLLEIVSDDEEQAGHKMNFFQIFRNFLVNLMTGSLNLKKFPIIADEEREHLRWSDIRDENPGKVVGLAKDFRTAIEEKFKIYQENNRKKKEAQEASRRIPPAPTSSHKQVQPVKLACEEETTHENKSKGFKFHR